jgi:ubiquinone/menaquinone biosynthesis C-methylase UbiE
MSALERLMILSPVRAWLQRAEVGAFRRWSALEPGAALLEVGCGNGVSTKLLAHKFRPRCLVAFDYDPSMVDLAHRRLRRLPAADPMDLAVADATHMPFADAGFDAVFEVGVIHHVPDWRAALREINRVLRPGGLLFFAEPSRGRLTRGLYRFIPHDRGSMFSAQELVEALADVGLELRTALRRLPFWDVAGLAYRASDGATGEGGSA